MQADSPDAVITIPRYDEFMARFTAGQVEQLLQGSLREGINACIECCDRHAQPGRVALFWEGKDGGSAQLTFAELKERSARLANLLRARGVQPGDRIAGLLPRIPDLLVVILGTWRAGAVYQPLFTAFGPKAIEYRVGSNGSEARLVFTDQANRHKLDDVAGCPPVIVVDADDGAFQAELAAQPASFEPVLRTGDDPFMMLFTSGTTGPAKGVVVPLKALLAFYVYTRWGMDVREEDAFWNIADPGWAYGLYYAVCGPLLLGHATTFYDGPFTAESTYRVIRKYNITNLAGSPTAYRLLIGAGDELASQIRGRLRLASSAGETLNPEVIRWFAATLNCPIHDHYGQTELGMVLNNHHGLAHPVHIGAAGFPMPGFHLAVIDDGGNEVPAGSPGVLAVDRARSPLMWFAGYWRHPTNWVGDYHVTGDTVEQNPDGSISFVGRNDDIITSSGYRIGPYDVESALIEHPAVAETAVVGKPDPERTELVKAFVVLRPGFVPSPELAEEMQSLVKSRLAAHAYPREIQFVAEIPKTPSGKLQRFILRNQEVEKARAAGQS